MRGSVGENPLHRLQAGGIVRPMNGFERRITTGTTTGTITALSIMTTAMITCWPAGPDVS